MGYDTGRDDDLWMSPSSGQTLTNLSKMKNPKIGKIYSRQHVEQAFLEAFDQLGGVTKLALWASDNDKNYAVFLTLLSKLFPQEIKQQISSSITYLSNLPPSKLNDYTDRQHLTQKQECPLEHELDRQAAHHLRSEIEEGAFE